MNSKQRTEHSKKQLSPLGKIDTRSLFGGYSLSVEKVVFALVSEGELYLRACENMKAYVTERQPSPLVFIKRGMPVVLNYYRVDGTLWNDPSSLLSLSRSALAFAQQQKREIQQNVRLKDLPNMGIRMETLLRTVGIDTVNLLKEMGAKRSWLKLREVNHQLGIGVLLSLQGAISGQHRAVLPKDVVNELSDWFNQATKSPKEPKK